MEFSLRHKLVTPIETPPETPPLSSIPTSPAFSPHPEDNHDSPVVITERTPLLPESAHGKGTLSNLGQHRSSASIKRMKPWLAASYASISGIMSGMCLLFAKSGVELLILTAQGDNQFWRWEPWALVFGLIAFALLQVCDFCCGSELLGLSFFYVVMVSP